MTSPNTQPLFLEQRSYRQRRLRDVARILPLLGIVLWLLPLLWPGSGEDAATTAAAVQYIFGVWIFLIGLTAWISTRLRPDRDNASEAD